MTEVDALVVRARVASRKVEVARQQMLAHARDRQEAVLAASRHLSVRGLAQALDCSPAVVQGLLRAARKNRSQIMPTETSKARR